MHLSFSDKTILVTGATRGIGKQIAEDLHTLGASLLLTGTHQDEIDLLNKNSAITLDRKKYFCVDLINPESVGAFLEQLDSYPVIDGIVNNAGINRLNYIADVESNDWDEMLSINLTAPFRLINHLSERMIANKYGRIVNIASIFSKISKEKRSVYSATKFGLHGLTVGISNDLARYNILANCVSPGFILTELTRKNLSEKEMEILQEQVPSKRLGKVSDISSVVIFLLSDLNQYLTGQNIVVDGGFTNV
jgi:NAD(P)-dependent dehydrogenase (short-subunit alcohol dehydrogenase family)